MKQRQSRRNRGRGDRALRKPRHNLSPFRRRAPKLNREPNSVLGWQGHRSICVAFRPAVADQSGPQIPGVGRVDNTSRRWVPFCGLTPPVIRKGEIVRGQSGRPPWNLRSATDRRIVPSSRSPKLGMVTRPSFRGSVSKVHKRTFTLLI
jgi:hypothetical protein